MVTVSRLLAFGENILLQQRTKLRLPVLSTAFFVATTAVSAAALIVPSPRDRLERKLGNCDDRGQHVAPQWSPPLDGESTSLHQTVSLNT